MRSDRVEGILFDIKRGAIHDGPGLRTTLFFKGCNLRCPWCHNPESFTKKIQGKYGQSYSVEELMSIIVKDTHFYNSSGGGVTFSGGEATMQEIFLIELGRQCKKEKIHCALETNGIIEEKTLQKLLPVIDLFLLDYKVTNQEKLIRGYDEKIWMNTLRLLEIKEKKVVLRCPIIPGINNQSQHIQAIKKLKMTYQCIEKVEFMPYHSIGINKWNELGYDYSLQSIKPPSQELIEEYKKIIT